MRILHRYILKESLAYFSISLLIFTGLMLTGRILKFTNLIVNKGVELEQIVFVFLSIIPTFLEIAIPMSALLGIMLAFARLSGDSEIVVIRATGISLTKLIKPVIIFGCLLTILTFFVTIVGRPAGFRFLSKTLFEIARSTSTAGLDSGQFNKLGMLTIYADKINHKNGRLKNVFIDDKREERRQIITAKQGKILSDPENRTISIRLKNGTIHEEYQEEYIITDFQINSLILTPDEIYNTDKKKTKRGREMYLSELNITKNDHLETIKELSQELEEELEDDYREKIEKEVKSEQKKIRRLKIEKNKRFSMPFAALLLALIAMPLGIQPPRAQKTWGSTTSLLFGLIVFIIYYAFISIGTALAESGTLNPILAVWLPNIFIALFTYNCLKQMGSEKWQSITDVLDKWLNKIFKKVAK